MLHLSRLPNACFFGVLAASVLQVGLCTAQEKQAEPNRPGQPGPTAQVSSGKTHVIRIYGEDGPLDRPEIVIEVGDTIVWFADDDVRGGYQPIASDAEVDPALAFKTGARPNGKSEPITFGKEGKVSYRAGRFSGKITVVKLIPQMRVVRSGGVPDPLLKSPDGKLTVVVDKTENSGACWMSDVATGQRVGPVLKHGRSQFNSATNLQVKCWAFSPDGTLLATAGGALEPSGGPRPEDDEGMVCVWDVKSGELVTRFGVKPGPPDRQAGDNFGGVTAVAFSKDSKTVHVNARPYVRDKT